MLHNNTSIANVSAKQAKAHPKLNLSKVSYSIILLIVAIVVAILVVVTLSSFNRPAVSDDFFVSDDTKTTISLTPSSNGSTNTALIETHLVYTYDGENVSGLKTYFEYPDEETARNTLESIKDQPEFKGAVVEGKYIVVTADEGQYKGLTTSDIRQQADALQKFQESQSSSKDDGAEAVNQEEQPREDDATNGSDDGSDGQ